MSSSKIPSRPATSSNEDEPPLARADEVADLLRSIQDLIVPFVRAADEDAISKPSGHGTVVSGGAPRTTLLEHHPPQKLQSLMGLELPEEGKGKEAVLVMAKQILQYSVNTWDQGFMDKLYHGNNAVSAGYLFHGDEDGGNVVEEQDGAEGERTGKGLQDGREIWDLADLTPQCGRKGDALKMFLGWLYYGRAGYAAMVERAYDTTAYLAKLVQEHSDMTLISDQPPPCLQVCFYYAKKGTLVEGEGEKKKMGKVTSQICRGLVRRGFMIDYAPGEKGLFLRAVVNSETRRGTVEGLVKAIEEEGEKVWGDVVET
ncbi:MAG: hypothetical protein Q9165_001432 [Trypethelium subeluteriae]